MAEVKPRYIKENEVVEEPQLPRSVLYENRVAILVVVSLVIIIFVAVYFILKAPSEQPPLKEPPTPEPSPQQKNQELLEMERLFNAINNAPPIEEPKAVPAKEPEAIVVEEAAIPDEAPVEDVEEPVELAPPQKLPNMCGHELVNGAICKVKTKKGVRCAKHK